MGAKLALFVGEPLVVIERDDFPGLTWPGAWDMPGGGREPGETPLGCALRETREELSLIVPPEAVTWGRAYENSIGRAVWFFAARLPAARGEDIVLGDEGQQWAYMDASDFLSHPKAVHPFKPRLSDYLSGAPSGFVAQIS
ncbi:NUDIX hydrolase [Tateyamaria sp.]|uniref:NUDIX hydrolase n=1 Tax=Tateyamaria sp. TaxID=1929288 RepID=UPI003B215890